MTGEELVTAMIKFAKGIAPDATVVVFGCVPVGGSVDVQGDMALEMANGSHYDLATVAHMITDMLVVDIDDVSDELDALKPTLLAEKPS